MEAVLKRDQYLLPYSLAAVILSSHEIQPGWCEQARVQANDPVLASGKKTILSLSV